MTISGSSLSQPIRIAGSLRSAGVQKELPSLNGRLRCIMFTGITENCWKIDGEIAFTVGLKP